MWTRSCDAFVRIDDRGDVIPEKDTDKCTFISNKDCPQIMKQCIDSEDCDGFLDLDFSISPGMTGLQDLVKKINPWTAYTILLRMGFGSYLADPEPGKMRYYKVQSVDSWSKELLRGCFDPDCNSLERVVGKLFPKLKAVVSDPSRSSFLVYLETLVAWVNANPTVLNPDEYEEKQKVHPKGLYGIYSYKSPYKSVMIQKNYSELCDMERMQATLMTNIMRAQTGGGDVSIYEDWYSHLVKKADEHGVSHNDSDIMNQLERMKITDQFDQESIVLLDMFKDMNREIDRKLKN